MSTLEEIEKVFGRGSYLFSDIDEICDNPYYGLEYGDFETMDAVSPFLNKRWEDVSSGMWKVHYEAVSYFSNKAFYFFLPSLIYCSYVNYDDSHLAVLSLMTKFRYAHDYMTKNKGGTEKLKESLHEHCYLRLSAVNNDEIIFMLKWMDYILEVDESMGDEVEIAKYVLNPILESRL